MHVWNKDTKTAIKTKGQKEIFALLHHSARHRELYDLSFLSNKPNFRK